MRRIWDVAVFAFVGPLKRTGGVFAWWSPVLAAISGLAAAIGFAIPRQVGGHWLAIAGLVGLCVVLFVAGYRLHRIAFPDFPLHKVGFALPTYVEKDGDGLDDLLLLDFSFTSRHGRAISLEVKVLWERAVGGQVLGPYECRSENGPLGSLELLKQPIAVAPDSHVGGHLAFTTHGFPFERGEYGEAFLNPDYRVRARLIDNVSGAETDVALPVRTSERQ